MNTTLQGLADICRKHPFDEKVLFVPSYSIGHQIGEHVARSGAPWINLRWTTTSGYAQRLLFLELSARNLRYINPQERHSIIEQLFRANGSQGRYFKRAAETPGIISCLTKAIHDIRMAGLDHKTIDPEAFIVREKGEELVWLLTSYEGHLEENDLIDHPGLLRMSLEKLEHEHRSSNHNIFVTLSDFPLTELEKRMIRLAGGKTLRILDHTRPENLKGPARFFPLTPKPAENPKQPKKNIELLPWIFDPRNAPRPFKDDSVSLYRALGESNEVREVFRRILKGGIPWDDVEIIVTTTDPYFPLLYEIAASLEIPTTFAGGLPVTYSRPGRALLLYLHWLAEDFQEAHFRGLISNGLLDLEKQPFDGERPPEVRAAALLREAAIGWGSGRYLSRLKKLSHSEAEVMAQEPAESEAEAKAKEKRVKNIIWLTHFVKSVLDITPATHPDEVIASDDLYRSALLFLKNFCRTASELDGSAKASLTDLIESLLEAKPFNLPLQEAIERLMKTITTLSVGHSTPKPGFVHVAHYRSGGCSGRGQTFVLGLGQERFPGALLQDPVILDVEREHLGGTLVPAGEMLHESVYMMAKLLGSLQGNVTLSYTCRDLREDRETFPASVLLGTYRVITGNHEGDYSDLKEFLGQPVGFIPDKEMVPLNDWEWWLTKKEIRPGPKPVYASYSSLYQGDRAEAERTKETLSEYDGLITNIEGAWHPFSKDVVLSCSRLEELARCPFAFFLHSVLGLEPLEEQERDYGRWLDPLRRGTLLHTIFYRFMKTLKTRYERPNLTEHLELMKEITQEEIEKLKNDVPCASEIVFQKEVSEIMETLPIFLRHEEERCQDVEPLFFELAFGMDRHEPIPIPFKGKAAFRLRGKIDRIDRCGEHLYEVWDYKSGGISSYKEHGYVDGGKQLQHALYAVAAETILRQEYDAKAKVIRGGYLFPTMRGEGRRIAKELDKDRLDGALEQLFTLLGRGLFPFSYEKRHCAYCHYVCVCGGPEVAAERCKEKLETDHRLEPVNILRSYE